MSLRFPVPLHAAFYAVLPRLPAQRRSRFRRLAEHLASGRWGGGTRVKKLRGFSKPVFEAREDHGARVLFTLARSARPDGGGALGTYLQVWDLAEHDRVTAAASRINRSPEARERVQALLRDAIAGGMLAKTGATRGTRYWPPAGRRE